MSAIFSVRSITSRHTFFCARHRLPSSFACAPSSLGCLLIRLGLVNKVLHNLVQIRVLSSEQENIIGRHGCATCVVAKRLQVGGHIF